MNERHAQRIAAHEAIIAQRRTLGTEAMVDRVADWVVAYPHATINALVNQAAQELSSALHESSRALIHWYRQALSL